MKRYKGQVGADYACFSVSRSVQSLHKFQDLLWDFGYTPNGVYPLDFSFWSTKRWSRDHLTSVDTGAIKLPRTSAVVGLNGGMAHVYLRRLAGNDATPPPRPAEAKVSENIAAGDEFESWALPPKFPQVIAVAEWFRTTLKDQPTEEMAGGYYRSLDMILVRDSSSGKWSRDYRVFLRRNPDGSGDTMLVSEYLQTDEGKDFMRRNQWSDDQRDVDFVVDRIQRLQGKMSGDLVLIPRYPDFYCEYKPLYGDHGSLRRSDFEIPFVVVQPGADHESRGFLQQAVLKGLDLRTKNRPANTDVKQTVLNLLRRPDKTITIGSNPAEPEYEFTIVHSETIGPYRQGEILLTPQVTIGSTKDLPEPYLLVCQLGTHRQYVYPDNVDGEAYEQRFDDKFGFGLPYFLLPDPTPDEFPDAIKLTAVFGDGTTASKDLKIPYKKWPKAFGGGPEGPVSYTKELAQAKNEYAVHTKGKSLNLSRIQRCACILLELERSRSNAQEIWKTVLAAYQNEKRTDPGDDYVDVNFAKVQQARIGGAFRRGDPDEFLAIIRERETAGTVQPGEYLAAILLLVKARNDTAAAHQLWSKSQKLDWTTEEAQFSFPSYQPFGSKLPRGVDFNDLLLLPKQPIVPPKK